MPTEPLSDVHGYGVFASRPAAGINGRYYYATDTQTLWRDNGTAWASQGGGSALTVEEVDGSPTDAAITKIVFPNGTLVIAAHVATFTPTAGFANPMTTVGDMIYEAAGATASANGSSTTSTLVLVVTGATETIMRDVAVSITSGWSILGSMSVAINVQVSQNQSGIVKHCTLRLRRTNVSGAILASQAVGDSGDSTGGAQFTWTTTYTDTTPTDGHYVVTVQADGSSPAGEQIYSASQSLTITGTQQAPPVATRLAIGTTGQALTVAGGLPTWAAGGGGAPNYVRNETAIEYTKTNTSYGDLDAVFNFTIVTGANPILCTFHSVASLSALGNKAYFTVSIDGVDQGGADGLASAEPEYSSGKHSYDFAYTSAPLAAGSHTVKLRVKVNSGTVWVGGSTTGTKSGTTHFGIYELAGGSAVPASAALLASQVLVADTAQVDFTGLSQAYKDLIVVVSGRSTRAGTNLDNFSCYIGNGGVFDTAGHYGCYIPIGGTHATTVNRAGSSTAGFYLGLLPGATAAASAVGFCEFTLPDYAGSQSKQGYVFGGSSDPGVYVDEWSGANYTSAVAAVDCIRVYAENGNLKAGTKIAIYGRGGPAQAGAVTVEEVDGSPTDSAISKLVFPNGTLAIAGHIATYTPPAAGASRVVTYQDAVAANSSTSSKVLTLGAAPTNGRSLILAICYSGSGSVSSVVQTNVTWTKLLNDTLNPRVELWVGQVGASAGTAITITYSGTAYNCAWCGEVDALAGTVDQSSVSGATTTGYYTGYITPTARKMVVAIMGTDNGSTPFISTQCMPIEAGINVTPLAIYPLSGSGGILGTLNVGIYRQDAVQTQVLFGNAGGNHASIIASLN